jgi:hypothetical protein
MSKTIKAQANGAAVGEKRAAEIAANGITASEGATVTQAGGALYTLALATSLISRTILEFCEQTAGVQQQLAQIAPAFTKAAEQSGNMSDATRVCEAVLPEIATATAKLEQVCSKQLSFWNGIPERVGILRVLIETIEAQVKVERQLGKPDFRQVTDNG